MTDYMDDVKDWIGKTQEAEGLITAANADILNATFDRDDPLFKDGDAIPPAWHWLYFPEVVKLSETAPDGHAARGGFLPPIPLPRRMWATTKMTFHQKLHVGERIRKVSKVTGITPKDGRSGPLCFVTIDYEIFGENGLATTEEFIAVYRGEADPNAPAPQLPPAPAEAVWHRDIHPTAVMLFRYSAVTMNSHRIHYDREYVTGVEGYPGLLVHGPLIAALQLDLFRRELPGATMKSFAVRAVSPVYDIHDFSVEGAPGAEPGTASLWALNHEGGLAQSAEVTFE